jgi:hypothetical protein
MTVEEVVDELYGLAPEEFTRARNARAKEAKAAGDPELAATVQSLRKPTTGAWLLNQLVRQHGDEVQQVLDLGALLRAAQGTVGADELRELDRQRRRLTHAVAQQARAIGLHARRTVTNQVVDDVEETLRSAMVDPEAGEALSSGLLTDTFSATGIDPVDLSGVVALGDPPRRRRHAASGGGTSAGAEPRPEPAVDLGHRRELAEARRALTQAEAAVRTARGLSERARKQVARAGQERQALEAERDEVRRALQDLEVRVGAAAAAEETAGQEHDEAARVESAAVSTLDERRERVEALLGAEAPDGGRRG